MIPLSLTARFFPTLLVLGAVAWAANGATTETAPLVRLTVTCDRPDAQYRCDEPVTFTIEVNDGAASGRDVEVVISKDGIQPRPAQHLKLAANRATVTAELGEPGFLQCRATLAPEGDQPAVSALGGAAIEPGRLAASRPPPADFEAFWSAEKQRLAQVPMNVRSTSVPSSNPAIVCFEIRADAIAAPVSGYLARPVAAGKGTLPAILVVPGAGVASASKSDSVAWAQRGMLALNINAHGLPNGESREFYGQLSGGALKDYWYQGRESRETCYYLGVFLRLIRAIDVLTAQPEWDGRVMVVHGYSQGGAQALVAAGLDPRVTFFSAGIPAMCDHSGFLSGRVCGWPKQLVPLDAAGHPDERVLRTSGYFDAVNFARLIRVPGVVSTGFIDTACPPTSVYVAYNTLTAPRQILTYPSFGHVHPPEMENPMREAILAHVREKHLVVSPAAETKS